MIEDIFEYLKNKIGCLYISDMQYGEWRIVAIEAFMNINPQNITITQYRDMCTYLKVEGARP